MISTRTKTTDDGKFRCEVTFGTINPWVEIPEEFETEHEAERNALKQVMNGVADAIWGSKK